MLLDPNDPRLANAPERFFSSFPSEASMLSDYFNSLKNQGDGSIGRNIITQANARTWRDALTYANKIRFTTVGVLSEWLPGLAAIGELPGGFMGPRGLFAAVAFPSTTSESQLFKVVENVALDVALDNLGAVPLVGGMLKFILGLGSFIDRLYAMSQPEEEKRLLLPWSKYVLETDENLVQEVISDNYFSTVDLTNLFRPPYNLDVPWSAADGVQEGKVVGDVWAPQVGGEVDFSGYVGGMPGTYRVAGHVQAPTAKFQGQELQRWFASGQPLRWGRTIVDCGKFYPATAQTCTLAWQQVNATGAPEMYCVDTHLLEAEWVEYFEQFFDSVWREFTDNDEWAGEFALPYLAVKGQEWRLGLEGPGVPPYARPHPAPLITPTIFTHGAATKATRNQCLFYEETISKPPQQVGATPDYIRENGRIVKSGGPSWDPTKIGKHHRCVPWPDGAELLAQYARPDQAILVPAIKRLRARQLSCLKHTLVCAYVRPRETDGRPAYGAFVHKDRGRELRDLCLEMRSILLEHEARFTVILKDVDAVDPDFGQQLRKAGVTNSLAQLTTAKQKLAGQAGVAGDASDPIPEPLPPQGGVPFDPGPVNGTNGAAGRGGGLLKVAAGGLAVYGLSKLL